jgi:hypothetical protein
MPSRGKAGGATDTDHPRDDWGCMSDTDDHLLRVYLHDHLASSAGGVDLARRVAKNHQDTPWAAQLQRLAESVERDKEGLEQVLSSLGMSDHHVHEAFVWAAEKVSRLKPNGQLTGRSPLSSLVELEAWRVALEGKRAGFTTLRLLAEHDDRLDKEMLDELVSRGQEEADEVEEIRKQIAPTVFRTDTHQEA